MNNPLNIKIKVSNIKNSNKAIKDFQEMKDAKCIQLSQYTDNHYEENLRLDIEVLVFNLKGIDEISRLLQKHNILI